MPANLQRLDILLGGDASGAVAAFDTAEQAFQRFQVKVAKGNLGGGGSGGGMFQQLIAGAGATAGAYTFQKVAESARDAATAIRTGGSESQTFGQIVNSIPIVGQFKLAGEAIREMITGEKAAIIEAEKLGAAAEKVSEMFHRMALERQGFGKRGDDLAGIQSSNTHDAERSAIGKRAEESDKAIAQFEADHAASSLLNPIDRIKQSMKGNAGRGVADYSAAEKGEYTALLASGKEIQASKKTADERFAANETLRKQDIAQRQLETFRAMDEQMIATQTTDKIKALRRQGLTIESALFAIDEHNAANYRSRHAQLDDTKLDALTGGKNGAAAKQLRAKIAAEDIAAEKSANEDRNDLLAEDGRKKLEIHRENEERITHIKAEGNIERMKLAHDDLGAELATIRESQRQGMVEAEKKQRETRRLQNTDNADPQLNEERKALALKAGIGSDLARDKNKVEQAAAQLSIEERLSKMRTGNLRDRAATGDAAAGHEILILEAQEHYHEKMIEIQKLAQDHNTTLQQRIELYGMTLSAADAQAAAVEKLSHPTESLLGATARAENSAHLSGLAQASREASEPKQIVKNTAAAAKIAGDTLTVLSDMLTFIQAGGGNFPLPHF